ncbi:MAG: hypothetical protein K2I37_09395 [Muribaculaceae bacterium]|nr:hypothetical protein [Muribaculaceae bacterium]
MKRYNRLYGLPPLIERLRAIIPMLVMICAFGSASGNVEHTVRYNYDDLTVSDIPGDDGITYSEIYMPEMENVGEAGSPALPMQYISFLVPSYSTDFSITVLSGEREKTLRIPHEIIPVQNIEFMNSIGHTFTSPDREMYSSVSDIEVRIIGDNFFEGWQHFVTVSVRPVSYDCESKEITCYNNLQLRLDYRECSAAEMSSPPVFPPEPRYSPLLSELVVNPPMSEISGVNRALSTSQPVNDRYIIVTTEDLKDDFENLAVWKRQKGYKAEVVTMESILKTPGFAVNITDSIWDEAAALRKWLKRYYQRYGHFFLLLAGDSRAGKMPVRKYHFFDYQKADDIYNDSVVPSDVYFADFSKEANNLRLFPNGLYSKQINPIMTPNLAIPVGRLMCQNGKEVSNYLRKLKLYEAWPGKGDMHYLDKGFVFCQQDGVTKLSGKYTNAYNNIFLPLSNYIYYSQMLDTIRENKFDTRRPTGAQVISAMKNVGLMSWQGHGQPGSIGCAGAVPPKNAKDEDKPAYWNAWRFIRPTKHTVKTGLSHPDYNNSLDLLGNVNKPAVAYSMSCTIMPFDYYSSGWDYHMGTSFTVAGDYGGVALLGNTRNGYWGPSTDQEHSFGKILINYRKSGVAEMLNKVRPSNDKWKTYVQYVHNLLGEPEFEIWLGFPAIQNFTISNSSSSYQIRGANLKGCTISAYDGISCVRCDSVSGSVSSLTFAVPQSSYTDRLISIWKTGMLPVMKLWANNVTLENITKTYSLPYVDIRLSRSDVCKYTLSKGATLNLLSVGDIYAESAFTLSGGTLYLEGESVKLTGTSSFNGGTLRCKAKSLELNGEFVITNCTLQVSPN